MEAENQLIEYAAQLCLAIQISQQHSRTRRRRTGRLRRHIFFVLPQDIADTFQGDVPAVMAISIIDIFQVVHIYKTQGADLAGIDLLQERACLVEENRPCDPRRLR